MAIGMWGKFQEELTGCMHKADLILGVGVIGLVLLLIVPLPPFLLDVLLCLNIVFSIMTLLLALYVEHALEFSSFPLALLLLTLYRLGLNIASTRMILTRAEGGAIIETFGHFVIDRHVGVGFVLFVLITTINFVVITKGAGRVAEVAARFNLEALPGKQMSIDAERAAGLIHQAEVKERHQKIEQEAEFYGAMDGASKFVRGDAIAGLLIVAVNLIGGLCIGLWVKHLSFKESLSLFTRLTVGDGLVTQLPALLISAGAGIMVTRCSSQRLSETLGKQFFCRPNVLVITAVFLIMLGLLPGMPMKIMAPMAILLGYYARAQIREKKHSGQVVSSRVIEIDLGTSLAARAKDMKESIREELAKIEKTLGITCPICRIKDNKELPTSAFEIRIGGKKIVRSRADGYELAKKIGQALYLHGHEFFGRKEVGLWVECARKVEATLVQELIPNKLSMNALLLILQHLLKEHMPISAFSIILESLAESEGSWTSSSTDMWVQKIRERLSKAGCDCFFGEEKMVFAIRLDPKIEKMIELSFHQQATKTQERLRPQVIDKMTEQIREFFLLGQKQGHAPVVMTEGSVRASVKRLIEHQLPEVPVFAYSEVTRDIKLETIGMVTKEVLS